MPKWLPAITLDLPTALPPSIGKITLYTRLFDYDMLYNVCFFLAQTLACMLCRYVQAVMVPTVVIVEAGGGGGYPSAAAVGVQTENCTAFKKTRRGCVDDWKSSLCNKYMSIRGYQTTKHCIAVYRLII